MKPLHFILGFVCGYSLFYYPEHPSQINWWIFIAAGVGYGTGYWRDLGAKAQLRAHIQRLNDKLCSGK